MKIDIHCLTDGTRGVLTQGNWGDARETACLMSALTGQTGIEGCAAAGWPTWLAELGTVVFDNAPESEALARGIGFAEAVQAAELRGADWDEVFCAFRLDSVLPIALKAVGEGDEAWRAACRRAVERAVELGGVVSGEAAEAAWRAAVAAAEEAAAAAGAAEAARAAWAAEAAWAAGAAWAAEAARAAARAEAHTRIYKSICKVLRGAVA